MVISKKTKINENFTPFGFIEWDIKNDTIEICPYLAEILAFTTTETTQTYSAYRQLTHPEDIAPIETLAKKLKDINEEYITVESRKLCRDGTWRWFSLRGKVTKKDKNGNPLQAAGICTDITHRKEAETEFQQMKLLFSEINHIKQCNKICKEECRKQDRSFKQACEGSFIRSEILKSLEKLTHSTNSLYISSNQNNLDQQGNNANELFDCNNKNIDCSQLSGEIHDFIKALKLNKHHTIQNGRETSLLGIYIDLPFDQHDIIILERKGTFENSILDLLAPFIGTATHIISFERLENHHDELGNITSFFIKQVPAAVAMFDMNMRYKFASNAWCQLYNLNAPSDLIGKSHYDVSPNAPKEWREKHSRGLAGEIISCPKQEVTGFTKEPFWTEWAIHPWYTPNKSIGGIIIYSNNITDRINSEKKLNTTIAQLTRSNEELDRFAHVCSHDLKEPLRGVSNFMNLLFKHNSEHFDEESLIYMRHILKSIDRMDTLIHDILLFSEVNQQSLGEKELLNLNDIVHEAKESFDLKLSEIGAQVKIKTLPIIWCVKTQFNQLFTNLISNAIKFRSESPLVIDVFALDKDDFWEIHVRDNGIGIAEEYKNDIFTMFKRLHSKSQYEGSGIGLATCKRIVNDHGGEIHVESAPEGGSDFVFTLPKVNE